MQGCKAVNLACQEEIIELDFLSSGNSLPEMVEELIEEGRLVEVEYTLPQLSFRLKSFLLPPGTQVTQVRNAAVVK
jgi:hypothetical protein